MFNNLLQRMNARCRLRKYLYAVLVAFDDIQSPSTDKRRKRFGFAEIWNSDSWKSNATCAL